MLKKILPLLLLAVLSGCAARTARAQFIGYTSPQTVAQNFAANCGDVVVLANLGQSVHSLNYQFVLGTGVTSEVFIEGSNNGFATTGDTISETGYTLAGQLIGFGYRGLMRARIRCFNSAGGPVTGAGVGNGTFQYSGTSAPSQLNGSSWESSVRKLAVLAGAAGTSNVITVSPPFGSTSGTIAFSYGAAGAGPAGSSLAVQIFDGSLTPDRTVVNFSLATPIGPQFFRIPHVPVASNTTAGQVQIRLIYTAGGASATSYNLLYYFDLPGAVAGSGADPCQSPATPKLSATIVAAAAATTQIIAGVANQTIFVCGYQMSQAVAAGTLAWTTGTGGVCGANVVLKSGAMQTIIGQPFTYGPGSTIFSAAAGSGVCLTTTGAGGTAAGIITFVQQ